LSDWSSGKVRLQSAVLTARAACIASIADVHGLCGPLHAELGDEPLSIRSLPPPNRAGVLKAFYLNLTQLPPREQNAAKNLFVAARRQSGMRMRNIVDQQKDRDRIQGALDQAAQALIQELGRVEATRLMVAQTGEETMAYLGQHDPQWLADAQALAQQHPA
jgi:hypothetical protein